MFFGMMLVDAALAAWAVGLMGQPNSPRWVRFVILWIGVTLVVSVGLVVGFNERADNAAARMVGLIAPLGAVAAAVALFVATAISRRKRR